MQFYVDKNTDLMRSTFIAVGIAKLLGAVPPQDSRQPATIQDQGSCYIIDINFSAEQLTAFVENKSSLPPLLPAILKPLTNLDKKRIEAGESEEEVRLKYVPRHFAGEIIDYEAEKMLFFQWTSNGSFDTSEITDPRPEFSAVAHLCSYFGRGSAMRGGYQLPLHAWHAHQGETALDLWKLIQGCYSSFPNKVAPARDRWEKFMLPKIPYSDYELKADMSSLAILSPSTTKGLSKVSGSQTLYEDTPNTFWLEMYFAFAGFLSVGMPYNISDDIVTYYPLPYNITFDELETVVNDYRISKSGRRLYQFSNPMCRAKVDALHYIGFYKCIVAKLHRTILKHEAGGEFLVDAIPGVVSYFYKNITNHIPFDETIFFTPLWFSQELLGEDALARAEYLLGEHEELINHINGLPPNYQLNSEELLLLETYRRFLTLGDAKDWVLFVVQHGKYHLHYHRDLPSGFFITKELFEESLINMSKYITDKVDYRAILENRGFKNISRAINFCTFYARFKKDIQGDAEFAYSARHGLGDDLLRHAHDPSLFIRDLSKFVQEYRDESITVWINTGNNRAEIHFEDVQDIINLIAEYGSSVVAHLLVACGYAAHFSRVDKSSTHSD